MVIVHEYDKYKYFDKQRKVDIIKYSNNVKKIHEGGAFYLPRRHYDNEGIFSDIIKFVSDNKDTIKNIGGVAASVADTVGKVGSTTLDIVKKARELKSCKLTGLNSPPAITEEATDKVLKAGSGFYYV